MFLLNYIYTTLSNLLDKHAPLLTKSIKQPNPWYTAHLKQLKAVCRKAERKWRKTHSSVWKSVAYFEHKRYRAAIANAKKQYYANAITDAVSTGKL